MPFTKKWKHPTGTRAYYAWRSMRARCYNAGNASYQNYGGRGVGVCDRWRENYDAFFKDMGNPPPGMSLDRVDNSKDYGPDNCRWATLKDQLNNQRRNRRITYAGMTMTLAQWATHLGVPTGTLHKRLERMTVEKALSAKTLRPWKHGTRAGYEGHKCRCAVCRAANTERHRRRRSAKLVADRLEGKEV